MSNWKCRRCSYENRDVVKNCKRCNNYNPQERQAEDNHWHYNHFFNDETVFQDGDQVSSVDQSSDEVIWIKDSCNISVQTTDTQASVSLQVGLQLAIALVVSIVIGDSDQGQTVAQDIFQQFNNEQTNQQRIYIDNSNDVNIVTTDTDLAVNIQSLLQVLVALVVKLDVL
jgi:spore coat protein X